MKETDITVRRRENMIRVVDMDGEAWKPIAGLPGYEVSNKGRIKSLNYWRWGVEAIKRLSKD